MMNKNNTQTFQKSVRSLKHGSMAQLLNGRVIHYVRTNMYICYGFV